MKDNKVYYKVLTKDMCSPYQMFQYELGKTYSTNEKIKLYYNGFHACKNMYELVIWTEYNKLKDCKFFECTLGDIIIDGDHKVVSNSITLTKEIPYEEVDKNIRENIDTLVHDKDWNVREAVARQRYRLDALIGDNNSLVRVTVANQGYGLDILINDEDWRIRAAVARQGYGLDILICDEDAYVRATVKQALIRRTKNEQQ